jgi:hypothetical protein
MQRGLSYEAIVGMLKRSLGPEERITPAVFQPNPAFVAFLHRVIRQYAPSSEKLQAEAARMGNGWLNLADQRSSSGCIVAPEDMIGAFQVQNGKLVADTYWPCPNHQLLTEDGFFVIEPFLREQLDQQLLATLPPAVPPAAVS